jgi:hypothetical protein
MCFQESETQKRTSSASLLQLVPFEVQITGTFWAQIDTQVQFEDIGESKIHFIGFWI